jgi:hypothetical protein
MAIRNLALTGYFENERCFRELRMTSPSLDRLVKGPILFRPH